MALEKPKKFIYLPPPFLKIIDQSHQVLFIPIYAKEHQSSFLV